jgi:hypothetical protein
MEDKGLTYTENPELETSARALLGETIKDEVEEVK